MSWLENQLKRMKDHIPEQWRNKIEPFVFLRAGFDNQYSFGYRGPIIQFSTTEIVIESGNDVNLRLWENEDFKAMVEENV